MKAKSKSGIALLSAFAIAALSGCGATTSTEKDPPGGNKDPGGQGGTGVYQKVDYTAEHNSADRFVYFEGDDPSMDDFLNDFAHRHMRNDAETRVGDASVGNSTRAAWREWDSLIGGWWDASSANGTMSAAYATNDAVNKWLMLNSQLGIVNSIADKQGYIWGEDNSNFENSWGMGWAFPDHKTGGKAWSFSGTADGKNWNVADPSKYSGTVSASKYKVTTGAATDEITITTAANAINAAVYTAPFLRLGFSWEGEGTVDDLYVQFTTSDSPAWSDDKKVKFSDFCLRGFQIGDQPVSVKDYAFPMYLNEAWGADFKSGRKITGLRITLKGRTQLSGTLAFDYIATDFDDRQPLNNCNYILAAKNNLEFSRDKALLTAVMPNARKAMNFLLHQLGGSEGLIDTSYLVGHFSDGNHKPGTGIGNGYWDVDAFPTVNLYCNISYYKALVAMQYLEEMASAMEIPFEVASTSDDTMDGEYVYDAGTVGSLEELAETCKTRIQTEFWNEKTGRFHVGVYDDGTKNVQDHGYVMFNEQTIAAGLATPEQEKSVMAWINGERTVASDDSTGEDIYYYEFAPRFNTQDIGTDFYWVYSCGWDGNVQNGGTALHLTYYDLLAQGRLGSDLSFGRLQNIRDWYQKVQAACGTGKAFYREYYDNYTDIPLQGNYNGRDHAGLVGVDCEFMEAALLFRAIPDQFFGLSTRADGVLCFQPNMPSGQRWWRIENLVYDGYYYDVSVSEWFVQISGVEEYKSGSGNADAKLEARFAVPGFKYEVRVNGIKTGNYSVADGVITVQVPFADAKIEIVGV